MLEKSCSSVFEIELFIILLNFAIFAIILGTEMPRVNIKEIKAQKLAEKEAKRAVNQGNALHMNAARSQSSPLDLSEPHANTDFHDIPCTPITHTAESTESQATRIEEGARAPS